MRFYLGLESLQGNAISRAEYLEDHGVLTWTGEPARQRDLESRIPTEDHGILPWTGEPARQRDLQSRIPRGPWDFTLDWRACKTTRSREQNT